MTREDAMSEIEENIIKYMKKYPNHVGNADFWEGFYACRNVVLQLDNEYSPKEQEPISVSVSEKEPDEISEEVTLRFFRNSLKVRWQDLVIYNVEWLKKNWQMEMDIVCGVKPCDDAVSRQAVLKIIDGWYEQNRDTENIEDLIVLITYMDSVRPQEPEIVKYGWTKIPKCTTCKYWYSPIVPCSRCKDNSEFKPQESDEISERNMKMWEEIFKAESEVRKKG